LWSIAKKLAAALGVGAALSILGASGYRPNMAQNETVVFTLRVLYALVPSLCNLTAVAIALAYPIDRDRHVAILSAIEKRRAGKPVRDPLRRGRTVGKPSESA
jgi:GPH family glycoside/pentoside/hexuronide:cation symporter